MRTLLLFVCITHILAGPLPPTNLLCEYLPSHYRPVVDTATPRFSWHLEHTARAHKQSAFRLQVFRSTVSPMLTSFTADAFADSQAVWDSSVIKTSQSTHVHYPSADSDDTAVPLESFGIYAWRVQWFDSDHVASDWSEWATFYVAALNLKEDTSSATWIAGQQAGDVKGNVQPLNRNNIFRRDFIVPGTILSGQVLICGLGYSELRLNGDKVDPTLQLGPAWTQYEKRVLYLHHDISDMLMNGNNTFGVMLGDGWRNETAFNNYDVNIPSTDNHRQTLWFIAVIQYEDVNNNTQVLTISSDNSWQTAVGCVVADSVYDGEWYDATRYQAGWDAPDFSPSSPWSAAAIVAGPAAPLMVVQSKAVDMRVSHVLQPLSVKQYNDGSWLVDFGQNFAGFCQLTLYNTTAQTTVVLRHAEILDDDGDGNIYTANLRSARATDTYITQGGDMEVYTPRFTYHGFRFVHISGYNGVLLPDNILALHFHSTQSEASSLHFAARAFKSLPNNIHSIHGNGDVVITHIPKRGFVVGDQKHNKHSHLGQPALLVDNGSILDMIHSSVVWGQRSNLMSAITDCDQRDERLGWMGDASLSTDAMAYNFETDGAPFFTNTAQNIMDSQHVTGNVGIVPDVVPAYRYGSYPSDPAWGSAFFSVVYATWKTYGDVQLVEQAWPQLDMFFNWYATLVASPNNWGNMFSRYGDWVPPPPAAKCSGSLVSGHIYILGLLQMIEMSTAVGNTTWINKYVDLYQSAVPGFNAAWLNNSTDIFGSGLQTEMSMGLHIFALNGYPTSIVEGVINNMLNNIVVASNTHITTGISGAKALMEVLTGDYLDFPRADVALQLAETLDYPSWGYMMVNPIEQGTTIWELMDAPAEGPGMNSRNHHMFSSVDTVLWENFGGISQPTGGSGFEYIEFAPSVTRGLSYARSKVNSMQGKVSMEWQRMGGVQCSKASESMLWTLSCGLNGGTISAIQFASYGLPTGGCGYYGHNPSCDSSNSTSVIASQCVGQNSCEIVVSDTLLGDPCFGKKKWLSVQALCSKPSTLVASIEVPVGSIAQIRLPLFDLQAVTVMDQTIDMEVYNSQSGYNEGVPGITDAEYVAQGNTVAIMVDSGKYTLAMSGSVGQYVCGMASENNNLTLTCPANTVISYINFASYGLSPSSCSNSPAFTIGTCHAGTSTVVFERACLGQSSCTVAASNTVFADPCINQAKHLIASVVCTSPSA